MADALTSAEMSVGWALRPGLGGSSLLICAPADLLHRVAGRRDRIQVIDVRSHRAEQPAEGLLGGGIRGPWGTGG